MQMGVRLLCVASCLQNKKLKINLQPDTSDAVDYYVWTTAWYCMTISDRENISKGEML